MSDTPTSNTEFLAVITTEPGRLWRLQCFIETRDAYGALTASRKIMESPPLIETEAKARAQALELARGFGDEGKNVVWDVEAQI